MICRSICNFPIYPTTLALSSCSLTEPLASLCFGDQFLAQRTFRERVMGSWWVGSLVEQMP